MHCIIIGCHIIYSVRGYIYGYNKYCNSETSLYAWDVQETNEGGYRLVTSKKTTIQMIIQRKGMGWDDNLTRAHHSPKPNANTFHSTHVPPSQGTANSMT